MKKYKLLQLTLVIALSLLMSTFLVDASEFTGSVSTGVNSGNVGGTVITAPLASPAGGTYTSMQFVALSAAGSSSIRYTTDGTDPTCSTGIPYHLPLPVGQNLTVKAIACYPSNNSSPVSTFDYIATSNIIPADMPNLLSSGVFTPVGQTSSASRLTANQQFTINVVNGGGTSTVTLATNTNITSVDGSNFDANTLSAAAVSGTSLAGLGSGVVVDGALHWGIANRGLTFDLPVSLSIYIGTAYNGQTLTVLRSISGSGDWNNDGISPATCVVSDGLCSFTATKASYYAATSVATTPTPTPASTGGGGGGGGTATPATYKTGDIDRNNKVDVFDFNTLMVNWGSAAANNIADFDGNGNVDIFDFNLLMVNWTG